MNSLRMFTPAAKRTVFEVSSGGGSPDVSNEFAVKTMVYRPSGLTSFSCTLNSCTGVGLRDGGGREESEQQGRNQNPFHGDSALMEGGYVRCAETVERPCPSGAEGDDAL